jgi:hypothetical protein
MPKGDAAEDPVVNLSSVQFQNDVNFKWGPYFGRSGGFAPA